MPNQDLWKALFQECQNYMLNLKYKKKQQDNPKPLLETERGTCIKGLLTSMASLELMMNEIINEESHDLV